MRQNPRLHRKRPPGRKAKAATQRTSAGNCALRLSAIFRRFPDFLNQHFPGYIFFTKYWYLGGSVRDVVVAGLRVCDSS